MYCNKRFPNAHLTLVGDGELREKILIKINKLQLTGRVHLTGNKNDPWKIYHSLDFIEFNLRGLGRSITEALSCGVPVVCTNGGGPRNC